LPTGLATVSGREKLGVENAVVIRAATRAIIDFFAVDMASPLSVGDGLITNPGALAISETAGRKRH
jgi:hypothetical protein